MAEQWLPTLGEQMLSADQERKMSMSGADRAAGQMGDLFSMAFPSLQTISRANAIKGLVRPLKEQGLLKANLPAVKTISKDIAMSPQQELDRITTVGGISPPTGSIARTTTTTAPGGAKNIDVSFNPTKIDEAAKVGTWWHELIHPRQQLPELGESGMAETLIQDARANKFSVDSIRKSIPAERQAVAAQVLMRDPNILSKMLVGGRVDPEMYNQLYEATLKKAFGSMGKANPSNLFEARDMMGVFK